MPQPSWHYLLLKAQKTSTLLIINIQLLFSGFSNIEKSSKKQEQISNEVINALKEASTKKLKWKLHNKVCSLFSSVRQTLSKNKNGNKQKIIDLSMEDMEGLDNDTWSQQNFGQNPTRTSKWQKRSRNPQPQREKKVQWKDSETVSINPQYPVTHSPGHLQQPPIFQPAPPPSPSFSNSTLFKISN